MVQKEKNHHLALLAALGGNAIWGFSFLFTRTALKVIALPAVLLSMRFVIATLIMTGILLTGKQTFSLKGKKLGPLLFLGIVEPLCFLLETYGVLYTNATVAGVVMAVSPIVSILLAAVLLHEIPTKGQLLFCLLPVAGVIMITVAGNDLGIVTTLGIVLLLGNCLTAGAYRTANRKSAEDFSAFERTYVVVVFSAVAFTVMALIQLRFDMTAYVAPLSDLSYVASLLVLSVFCSVVAYLLVNYGSGLMSVAKMATFGAVSTVCSTFAGVVLLKEPVSWMVLAGAALIIVGVWQVTRKGK
ncbi:MAG: DMT family transporter [Ruminococcaceae bacterium]|nr:DMT family transporter [Oscillospiraceae bacterium]